MRRPLSESSVSRDEDNRIHKTPIGDRLVVAVDEMAMVHLMRERRDDGWSLGMIADAFNSDSVPGKNGGKWYARTVKNILENSLYRNVGEPA